MSETSKSREISPPSSHQKSQTWKEEVGSSIPHDSPAEEEGANHIPPSLSDEVSLTSGNTSDLDNFEFDFVEEDDGAKEETNIWQHRTMREAFLRARDDYEKFELALKADKKRRVNETATIDPFPLTDKVGTREVQQRWFLVLENRLEDDPFLGIDALPATGEPPESMLVHSLPSTPPDIGSADENDNLLDNNGKTLKLRSTFSSVAAGQYTMYLRTKQAIGERTAARFLARIVVRYSAARTADVFYTSFFKRVNDECQGWHYLKAEGQFEIRAHHGVVQANVHIIQDSLYNPAQRGKLWIRSLELVPVELGPTCQEPIFSRAGRPDITIATQPTKDESLGSSGGQKYAAIGTIDGELTAGGHPKEKGVITRVATSKRGDCLAALTVFSSYMTIQVWDKVALEKADRGDRAPKDVSRLGTIAERIECPNARDFSFELAVSASGEQIAVFQLPKVGDWQIGDSVPESKLGVRLFSNPLATARSDIAVMVADEDHVGLRLESFRDIPSYLQNAVGYAAFVDEFGTDTSVNQSMFVFCNGLYLDVYVVAGDTLVHSHTISLVNKASGLYRTAACEMMMDSIASNMFIWVEEDGRHCTTWDLTNGSAIGRFQISRRQRPTATSLTSMKFARNRHIVAVVGFDNSITTLDARSGMELSRRSFKDQIEHLAFPSPQSPILIVLLRREEESEQRVLVYDPLHLDVKGWVQLVPPLSRSTIFCSFGPGTWPGLGLVCQPDGDLVHFYTSRTLGVPSSTTKPTAVGAVSVTCPYELKISAPRYRRSAGGGQESCRRQVEIWKKGQPSKCVFSFIPEPWEQDTPVHGMILPTGDRFVVHSSWTIQLWSLPTDDESRCRLLFYWCALDDTSGNRITIKPDIDAVLDTHLQFASVACKEYTLKDGQTQFLASVVFHGFKPIQVPLPKSPVRIDDFQNTTEHCIRSIHLLALTHSITLTEYCDMEPIQDEGSSYEDHIWAIIDFVNEHLNHSIEFHQMAPTFAESISRAGPNASVLTHLLMESCPNDISAKFLASLLQSDDCNWVPLHALTGNPIETAIDRRNTAAVVALLDYCTNKAYSRHPAYLNLIELSLAKLQRHYPELLRSAFRNASYIPARRDDFCKDWVSMASFGRPVLRRPLFTQLNFLRRHFREPIVTFQLPTGGKSDMGHSRVIRFEKIVEPMPVRLEYECTWYVVPFPSLINLGPESRFCSMAGENFFDSPALMVILRYKTWQYGIVYWLARYILLLLFYGIFVAMITGQLQSSEAIDSLPGLEPYLGTNWVVLVIVGLVIGCYLLLLEMVQLYYVGFEYFRSLYNYIDIASIILTLTCFSHTIRTHWRPTEPPEVIEQFGPTPFAILAMYLHVIAETRIFRRVGTIVNIIVQIISKIWDFFIVFALVVAGFTHAFVYFFHAYRTDPEEVAFPRGVLASFTTTFFFLAGRYDPIDEDFNARDENFLVLIMFFYLFASVVMLTVLIALMTDAFSATREDGEQAWRMQLSEALAEAEMTGGFLYFFARLATMVPIRMPFMNRALSSLQRSRRRAVVRYSPTYLYYAARTQDSEFYLAKLKRASVESLEDENTDV